jgi:multimeric flavodoxin WrbA
MFVLGISSSPRQKGFTTLLLNESLAGAISAGAKTDKIILNDLNIRPCRECWQCADNSSCPQTDDMKIVYDKVGKADAIIIASPVYFTTVPAQLKLMIDRFNSVWSPRHRNKKIRPPAMVKTGAFICVAGENKAEYFRNSRSVVKAFFGTAGIKYSKELFVGGTDKLTANSTAIKRALSKSYRLGASLVKTEKR